MSTIMPQGELLRRAVKWIDEQHSQTDAPLPTLLDQAAMKFNLSPKDTDFLTVFFKGREEAPRD